jgi:hypothetical protein
MIHIHRFIERLQGQEARGGRDFVMPIKDAKDLHADITKLLLTLEQVRENAEKTQEDRTVTVEMSGGPF